MILLNFCLGYINEIYEISIILLKKSIKLNASKIFVKPKYLY